MTTAREPNPPSRKEEDFPKTNTIPDGWVMDALMERYNRNGTVSDRGVSVETEDIPVPTTGGNGKANGRTNGRAHNEDAPAPSTEDLFTRRLEPFQSPSDAFGMWL